MDKPRPCGCKGRRTCLLCEKDYDIQAEIPVLNRDQNAYIYCPFCNKAWPGWNLKDNKHPVHLGESIDYPGIFIQMNFLSEDEEKNVLKSIDDIPWDLSQSGRRKQNFGPKCNFRKKKIKVGPFRGFPLSTKFIQDKFKSVPMMTDFQTIEQCSLEYNPERGASIDPHVDDCWIWGERIVTVNLLADSILTMTHNSKPDKYNLDCVKDYPSVLDSKGNFNLSCGSYKVKSFRTGNQCIVRVPLPKRSLFIMYNSARYDWEHQILREDIVERRVCIAYREFTPPYLKEGEYSDAGRAVIDKATNFWDVHN